MTKLVAKIVGTLRIVSPAHTGVLHRRAETREPLSFNACKCIVLALIKRAFARLSKRKDGDYLQCVKTTREQLLCFHR